MVPKSILGRNKKFFFFHEWGFVLIPRMPNDYMQNQFPFKIMRFSQYIRSSAFAFGLSGCSDQSVQQNPSSNAGPTGVATTNPPGAATNGPFESTAAPGTSISLRPTTPPSSNCPGKRLGQYSWGTELWREGSTELSKFFGNQAAKDLLAYRTGYGNRIPNTLSANAK